MSELPDWPRKHYQPGGGDAFVALIIYGPRPASSEISPEAFRSNGMPDGADLRLLTSEVSLNPVNDKVLNDFLDIDLPDLAESVRTAGDLALLQGTIADPPDLNYFRDIVGIIEWFFAANSVAVCDLTSFKWWDADRWHRDTFETTAGAPRNHVTILTSEHENGSWLHTRGMIKFGRADLSIHEVTSERWDLAVEIINRFIEFEAFGGLIEDGLEIRMRDAPQGMICRHKGDFDDPDFNNVHVEILWPE